MGCMVTKVLVFSLAGLLSIGAAAQQHKVESIVQGGLGVFIETTDGRIDRDQEPGIVLKLSYGLDIPVAGPWSALPGIGLRTQVADIRHFSWKGGDPDGLTYADAFLLARYHLTPSSGSRIALHLGPDISYELTKENYYIDWDPRDPLSGKRKYKPWDIGILTGLTFEKGSHWQFGAEATLGLRSLLLQYPNYPTANRHFHTLMFTCGYRF